MIAVHDEVLQREFVEPELWDRPAGDDSDRGSRAESLQSQLDERNIELIRLTQELAMRDAALRELQSRAPESPSRRQDSFAEQIAELCEQTRQQNRRVAALTNQMERMQRTVLGALEHVPGADGKIQYQRLVGRIRHVVKELLPLDAMVLVVSKGDEELLELEGRCGLHFPQDLDARYPGFHPADSGSAIVQLEALRAKGADYFLLPQTFLWWLDHYAGFRRHLERYYRRLEITNDCCTVFSLSEAPQSNATSSRADLDEVFVEFESRFDRMPTVLDWGSGLGLAERYPHISVFSPPLGDGQNLAYLDQTCDLVVVSSAKPARLPEARRVAAAGVVIVPERRGPVESRAMRVEWLGEPKTEPLPTTSIIIPSYNGISLTENCLRALAESLPRDFRGEIIVVDDCSTDDTQARLEAWKDTEPRLKVLRNPENCGFLVTCNNGASAASGEVVILLNNDTLPQRGWLEPLLRLLRDKPDAGAVGGKLVYPDGRLQEAGGVVFADGSAANFGKWEYALDDPLFNYVREVDYVTGALIATRRELFNALGQLDTRYRPIYYEETDYCFRLREQGYKVYYQPESVVIHLEGVTCGTDPKSGLKRNQLVNQAKFKERWREALLRQPQPPERFNMTTWHELAAPTGQGGELP